MKLLALDTSALVASAALLEDGICRGEVSLNHKLTHSQTIMPMIDQLLQWTGTAAEELDYIACAEGPG